MNLTAADERRWSAMKTTLHLHRPVPPPARVASHRPHPTTVRLGVVLSLLAALVTIVLEAVLDIPVLLIVVPVVAVGFALSWRASRPRRRHADVTGHRTA
jgi:hypothetical protein